MYCQKCGNQVTDDVKFCPECGLEMKHKAKGNSTIQLRCKACDGIMNVEEDSPILYCSYCGAKELIRESDDVTIQRIKSKAYKEIELEKLKAEEGRERRQEEKDKVLEKKENLQKFKKRKLSKFIVVFFVICLLMAVSCIANGAILPGLMALVQTGLFAVAWLMGMQFVKEKFLDMHILLAVIGFVLIVPFFVLVGWSNSEYNEKYVWPSGGLCTMLPQPNSNRGSISDSKDYFFLSVYKVSKKDFEEYIKACEKNGFIVEAERDSTGYKAYDEQGYQLEISYYDYDKSMNVRLHAPKAITEFKWPDSEIAGMLPKPKSTMGKVEWETDYGMAIYVGETSTQDFQQYVDACRQKGFDVNYRKGDDYYNADNEEGYSLSLKYEGNKVMFLRLEKPKGDNGEKQSALKDRENPPNVSGEKENSSSEADVAKTEIQRNEESLAGEVSSAVPGIRPEFKAALDSYEKFFDEYCEFMQRYSKSDDVFSMMADYGKFMTQYVDTMQKMDALGEEEMSEEESTYYLEVLLRINQKLLTVATQT